MLYKKSDQTKAYGSGSTALLLGNCLILRWCAIILRRGPDRSRIGKNFKYKKKTENKINVKKTPYYALGYYNK